MIGNIYKANTGGASPSLAYNEGKVSEGVAELVLCRNIEDDDPYTISRTFQERENNPAVADHFHRKGFHATINPDTGDALTQDECLRLIAKVMEGLGYGEQPFVVYRHNDIDREHYHIVSTRVGKDFKRIDNHREGARMVEILRSLEKEFGFKVGRNKAAETAVSATRAAYPHFDPKSTDKFRSLKAIFLRALKFNVHNIEQLRAVLATMNVGMSNRTLKSGKHSMGFYGMGEGGKKMTTSFSLRRIVGPLWQDRLQEVFESQPDIDSDQMVARKISIGVKNSYCLSVSRSREEYVDLMAQLGVGAVIKYEPGTREISRVILVDQKTNTIADTDWRNEIWLSAYHNKEKQGEWGQRIRPEKFRKITDSEKAMLEKATGESIKKYFGEKAPEMDGPAQDEGITIDE